MPALSAFLPANYDPARPLVLIAGQGRYPQLIAAAARRAGLPLRLIAAQDETAPELIASFPEADRRIILVGQIGKMLKSLEEFAAGYALMAGQISPRKLFSGLHPDLKATRILFSLKRRNAETIFGAVAKEIEALGVTLLDARSYLDDQLATAGCMTGRSFGVETEYLQHGIQIARECARLDIGQGCVVRKGTVLAVEAFEGTDEMLRRAGGFKTDDTLFVKTVKARQDFRFDVPVIGLQTVQAAAAARIRVLAVEAGRTLLLDRDAMLAEASRRGLTIAGYPL